MNIVLACTESHLQTPLRLRVTKAKSLLTNSEFDRRIAAAYMFHLLQYGQYAS
jgi:hypothetical protein